MPEKRTAPRICETCGKDFFARWSEVSKGGARFCSVQCINIPRTGSNNPNWKGGISKIHTRYTQPYKEANPDKVRTHHLVSKAISSGKLARGVCEHCGSDQNIDGHHEDYSRPLSVTWLCRSCHIKHHKEKDTPWTRGRV